MSDRQEIRPVGWTGPTGTVVEAHLRGWSPLDNHQPTRHHAHVDIERWRWPDRGDGFVGIELSIIGGLDKYRHGRRALWLVDDGETVTPYYTCGYHETGRYIGLKKYPVGLESGVMHTYYLRVREA